MSFNRYLCSILLATLALPAIAQSDNPMLRHIPADADNVYHLNGPVLDGKLKWEDIPHAFFYPFKGNSSKPDVIGRLLLENGVLRRKEFFIANSNMDKPDSFHYTTLIFHLADSGKFIALLHDDNKALRPQPITGCRAEGSMFMAAAFNDKLGILVLLDLRPNQKGAPRTVPTIEWQLILARRAAAALRGFDHSFFTTSAFFKRNLADNADLHFYSRHGDNLAVLKYIFTPLGMDQITNIASAFFASRQGPAISSLQFEPGKVTYTSRQLLSPADTAGKGLTASLFNERLKTTLPMAGPLFCALSLHVDWAGFLKRPNGGSAILFPGLAQGGDDPRQFTGGDMLVIVPQPNPQLDEDTGGPDFLCLASVTDRPSFDKWAASREKLHFYSDVRDNIAIMGTNPLRVKQFFDTTATPEKSNAARVLTDNMLTNSFGVALDLHLFSDFISRQHPSNANDAAQLRHFAEVLSYCDRLSYTTGIHDGQLEAVYQLNMADQANNSLSPFLRMMQVIYGP